MSASTDQNSQWIDIVFVLDVSKSMNVYDFEYEWQQVSRLQASKLAIQEIVQNNLQNRYWLVVFAWEAVSVSPLTYDRDIFLSFLSSVDYRNLWEQWTNLWDAYLSAIKRVESPESSLLVLISDGWDEEVQWINNRTQKIQSSIYGIGTKNWWEIISWTDVFWRPQYETYNWERVIVWLNETNLKKLAREVNADYETINDFNDLDELTQTIASIETKDIEIGWQESSKSYLRILSLVFWVVFMCFILTPFFSSRIQQIRH